MAAVFRHSNKTRIRQSKPSISHHVRSISLPCRSHPLISHLKDDLAILKTWSSSSDHTLTSSSLYNGLTRLKSVHDSPDDVLQLPQTQEYLCRQTQLVEKLLEYSILLIDAYGIFQTFILALKEEHSSAQVAMRKKDEENIAFYVKARKKTAKEMSNLVSTVRCIKVSRSQPFVSICDDEVAGVIQDVIEVTALVSTVLFNGIAVSFKLRSNVSAWIRGFGLPKKVILEDGIQEFRQVGMERLWDLKKKGDEEVKMVMKNMQVMEDCLRGIESGSERVFRSLINSRVSLLNVLTR